MYSFVCQRSGCGVFLRIEESKNHIHCDKCGQAFQQEELENHMKVFHEALHCPVEHQASVFPLRLITCQFCGDMVQAGRSAMNARDRLRGLSERSVMLKDMDIHRIVVHQSG
ncbi:hypothetical protein JHK86_039616 [Glycine max]|nr:hypothetical protein JHK86_039616 [Glycine max]